MSSFASFVKKHRGSVVTAAAFFVLAVILSFYQLGHYALWDDEALNALGAKGVMQTGDTTLLLDHGKNIVLFNHGMLSNNLHDRSTPPLPAYVTAVSFAIFGQSSFTARLPFVLMGLLAIGLMLACAVRYGKSRLFVFALGMALACNVSILLYMRQSRYYAATCLFSLLVVLCYAFRDRSRKCIWLLPVAGIFLFWSNYMNFLALFAVLFIDYLFFEYRVRRIPLRDWVIVLLPMAVVCGLTALVWNPLRTSYAGAMSVNTLWDRVVMWWWQWRDMNACEFVSFGMLALAIIACIWRRDRILLRCFIALVLYVTFIAVVMPQDRHATAQADIRYILPMILMLAFMSARAIALLVGECRWFVAIPVAVVAFCTNIFNGGPLLPLGARSTLYKYVGELYAGLPDPYRKTSDWVNANIPENASVWVQPDYMVSPLLFHSPGPVYAWQALYPPKEKQFENLPQIFYQGMIAPDYIICFGPGGINSYVSLTQETQRSGRSDLDYEPIAKIDVFYRDLYRPELFWRSFDPITNYNQNYEAIYVLKRKK